MEIDSDEGGPRAAGDGGPGGFTLEYELATPTRTIVEARWGGESLRRHSFDLDSATARERFGRQIAGRAKGLGLGVPLDVVERELIRLAGDVARSRAAAKDRANDGYAHVEDPDDAEASGMFRDAPSGAKRLSNFTASVAEDVTVLDEVAGSRDFVVRTWLGGRRGDHRMTAEEFASNERLKAAIFRSVGPTAQILTPSLDELRRAISAGASRPVAS